MKNRSRAAAWLGALAAVIFFLFPGIGSCQDRGGKPVLVLFFSPSCHECQKVKNEFLPRLERSYGDRFTIEALDIGVMENYRRLFDLSKASGRKDQSVTVPSVYFKGKLLVGGDQIEKQLEGLVRGGGWGQAPAQPSGGGYNPLSHFMTFTPLAVTAAGLVDGINPCAFTVIVFFVSFLAMQGFHRRHLALIGGFFIAGVFVTYLLIGLGLLGFFYRLSAFWWVRAAVNWLIGLLSIGFGVAAVADAVRYRATGKTDGMLLSLPQAVKNRIHSVIGMRYRGSVTAESRATFGRLVLTAFVTGFLVSLLEAVCTGQMYLPTIIFVLKSTTMKPLALAYLLLYNLMFIVPLAAVLVLSVFGTSSGQFSRFMSRHFLAVKGLMAALFFLLGVYLLWRGV